MHVQACVGIQYFLNFLETDHHESFLPTTTKHAQPKGEKPVSPPPPPHPCPSPSKNHGRSSLMKSRLQSQTTEGLRYEISSFITVKLPSKSWSSNATAILYKLDVTLKGVRRWRYEDYFRVTWRSTYGTYSKSFWVLSFFAGNWAGLRMGYEALHGDGLVTNYLSLGIIHDAVHCIQ